MGLETDWSQLAASTTLSWEPMSSGFAGDGTPTYGPSTTAPALVQYDRRLVQRADGQTELARASIFVFSTTATIGLQDRITIPGSTETPRILSVDRVSDDEGQHHIEVMIA